MWGSINIGHAWELASHVFQSLWFQRSNFWREISRIRIFFFCRKKITSRRNNGGRSKGFEGWEKSVLHWYRETSEFFFSSYGELASASLEFFIVEIAHHCWELVDASLEFFIVEIAHHCWKLASVSMEYIIARMADHYWELASTFIEFTPVFLITTIAVPRYWERTIEHSFMGFKIFIFKYGTTIFS